MVGRLSLLQTTTDRVPKTLISQMKSMERNDSASVCVSFGSLSNVNSNYVLASFDFRVCVCVHLGDKSIYLYAKWHEGRKPKLIKINRPPPPFATVVAMSSSSGRKKKEITFLVLSDRNVTFSTSRLHAVSPVDWSSHAHAHVGRPIRVESHTYPNAPPNWYHAIENMMSYTHSYDSRIKMYQDVTHDGACVCISIALWISASGHKW